MLTTLKTHKAVAKQHLCPFTLHFTLSPFQKNNGSVAWGIHNIEPQYLKKKTHRRTETPNQGSENYIQRVVSTAVPHFHRVAPCPESGPRRGHAALGASAPSHVGCDRVSCRSSEHKIRFRMWTGGNVTKTVVLGKRGMCWQKRFCQQTPVCVSAVWLMVGGKKRDSAGWKYWSQVGGGGLWNQLEVNGGLCWHLLDWDA